MLLSEQQPDHICKPDMVAGDRRRPARSSSSGMTPPRARENEPEHQPPDAHQTIRWLLVVAGSSGRERRPRDNRRGRRLSNAVADLPVARGA